MATLYELAKQAEPGDRIRWVGARSDVENPEPREITRVVLELGQVTVEAAGPDGADGGFDVANTGSSETRYQGSEMGAVRWAELVDKGVSTRV